MSRDVCPHGIDLETVWTPADPPNCPPCFFSLSAALDELEMDNPAVRDAAIRLADVLAALSEEDE